MRVKLLRWSAYLSLFFLIIATMAGVLLLNAHELGLERSVMKRVHIISSLLLIAALLFHGVVGMVRILKGWAYKAYVAFSLLFFLLTLYGLFIL